MARTGLAALLCVTPLLVTLGISTLSADPVKEPEGAIEGYLLAQTAMLQGEMYLLQRQPARAVEVLESQLPRINVNRKYLAVLRDAYRAYINELSVKDQKALAEKYAARLRILEANGAPAQAAAQPAPPPAAVPNPAAPVPVPAALAATPGGGFARPTPAAANKVAQTPPAAPAPTLARAKADPFDLSNQAAAPAALGDPRGKQATSFLAQAEAEFARKRFIEARKLYEEAHRHDDRATRDCRERWAYCKLAHVVDQINNTGTQSCPWPDLEREVRVAMEMAPNLSQTGKWLLGEIEGRRAPGGDRPAAPVEVKHVGRDAQGWDVAETRSFRVLHKQARELAEKVARTAEQTRADMTRKWFGGDGEEWSPKCDVYLHPTAQEYRRFNGVAINSPGHSRIETDRETSRVVRRVIHLHCENPDGMLTAVLPHEATHVVLAGRFGTKPVPRWADEGMAVLTEPVEKVAQHRRNLARSLRQQELFGVRELMQLTDYPQPARISAFYAQSVSLVEYLCGLRGPQTFSQFLRDGVREGYEPALRRHYNLGSFADLQGRWSERVTAEVNAAPGTSSAGR